MGNQLLEELKQCRHELMFSQTNVNRVASRVVQTNVNWQAWSGLYTSRKPRDKEPKQILEHHFLLGDPQVALESPCQCHSRAARVESQPSPFDQTEMGKCSSEPGASPKKQHESLPRISLSRTGPILIMIKVSPVAKFERETTPVKMEGFEPTPSQNNPQSETTPVLFCLTLIPPSQNGGPQEIQVGRLSLTRSKGRRRRQRAGSSVMS